MIAIYKRELNSYFCSPIAYVFIGFFLLLSGYFFSTFNVLMASSNLGPLFGNLIMVILFIVPILTMKLFAEEKKSKTEQLLFTSPVSLLGITMGKFLAAFTVFLTAVAGTLLYTIVLFVHSTPDIGIIFCNYLNFVLIGGVYISIGMFISSLTENQIIAAVASFVALMIFWTINMVSYYMQNETVQMVLEYLSVMSRVSKFMMGLISVDGIIYYLSLIVLFIFLTVQKLDIRRFS